MSESLKKAEKALSDINAGRAADLVLSHLYPVLERQRTETLSALKSEYRAGSIDQIKLQCKLAELCVLDDLEQKLRSQITKGSRAHAEQLNVKETTR